MSAAGNNAYVAFIASVVSAGANTVTVTVGGAAVQYWDLEILEYTASILDNAVIATGNSSTLSSGNITTSGTNETLVMGGNGQAPHTLTPDGTFTVRLQETNIWFACVADKSAAVPATYSGSFNSVSSAQWFCAIVALQGPVPPIITSLNPASGSTSGGESIWITGTGFTGTTAVHFGANSATFFFVNPNILVATSPANSPSSVGITVTTLLGTCAPSQFLYDSPPTSVLGEVVLNGKYLGTPGSYPSETRYIQYVFDANELTCWDGPDAQNDWVGIDAGVASKLTRFRLSPKPGLEDRSISGQIQASNDVTFTTGVVNIGGGGIFTRPLSGQLLNEYLLTNPGTNYRYFRWLSQGGASYGGIADLELLSNYIPGMVSRCAPVTFSPNGGVYDLPIAVTLSSLTSSALIYYTTDGSIPSSGSSLYNGPFVTQSSVITAIAILPGLSDSRVTSQRFTIGDQIISTNVLVDSNRGARVWAVSPVFMLDPVSKKWYMYGDNNDTPSVYTAPGAFMAHNIYSSSDLLNWKYEGNFGGPGPGLANGGNQTYDNRVEVIYNAKNNNYVCWITVAFTFSSTVYTSPSPTGPWTFFTTYGTLDGFDCAGDVGLFIDPADGVTAYLLRLCDTQNHIGITRLNSDYTQTDGVHSVYYPNNGSNPFGGSREQMRMFSRNGVYFWMTSGTTGWAPNTNLYVTSNSPLGPIWSAPVNPFQNVSVQQTPEEVHANVVPTYLNSYDSQVNNFLYIPGRNAYIYTGDRWGIVQPPPSDTPANDNFLGHRVLFLPISFPTNTTMTITWNDSWSFDESFTSSNPPLAAIALSITDSGFATWSNQELTPCNIYIDGANDVFFTKNVISTLLPTGSSFVQVPFNRLAYRIRSVNSGGSSVSNYFSFKKSIFEGSLLGFSPSQVSSIQRIWNERFNIPPNLPKPL